MMIRRLQIPFRTAVVFLGLLCVYSVNAQEQLGSISGTITIPDSTSVANVVLTAVSQVPEKTQSKKSIARTDEHGNFQFKSLPAGTYLVQLPVPRAQLFKQISYFVPLQQDENKTVDISLQFIDQCAAKPEQLTSTDKTEIVNLMLDKAINRYKLLSSDIKEVLVSTKNIAWYDGLSNQDDPKLRFLSPDRIQNIANEQGTLMYLQFKHIEPRGSCVGVDLDGLWATPIDGPKLGLGQRGVSYFFYKQNGKWV